MRYETDLLTGEVTEYEDAPVTITLPQPEPEPPLDYSALRAKAYREESDPVYFKEQRGEVPQGTWIALVNEIRSRYPDPA